jgi:hypothetical protein
VGLQVADRAPWASPAIGLALDAIEDLGVGEGAIPGEVAGDVTFTDPVDQLAAQDGMAAERFLAGRAELRLADEAAFQRVVLAAGADVEARLIGGPGELVMDAQDGLPLGDDASGQRLGEVAALARVGQEVALDGMACGVPVGLEGIAPQADLPMLFFINVRLVFANRGIDFPSGIG